MKEIKFFALIDPEIKLNVKKTYIFIYISFILLIRNSWITKKINCIYLVYKIENKIIN